MAEIFRYTFSNMASENGQDGKWYGGPCICGAYQAFHWSL